MKANNKPKVRQITHEEWLDMVIFPEGQRSKELELTPSKPNKALGMIKKTSTEFVTISEKSCFCWRTSCIATPENFKSLLKDAAFASEQITRRLRHLLYLATDIRKPDYLIEADKKLDMTVSEHNGIIELTSQDLSQNRNHGKVQNILRILRTSFLSDI